MAQPALKHEGGAQETPIGTAGTPPEQSAYESLANLVKARQRIRRAESWTERLARAGADAIALAIALGVGALVGLGINELVMGREYGALTGAAAASRIIEFLALAFIALTFFAVRGHYSARHPFWTEARDIALAVLLFGLADGFLQFAFKEQPSRLWLVATWAIALFTLVAGRLAVRHVLRSAGRWNIRTLMIGDGGTSQAACEALHSEPYLGYEVVAKAALHQLDPENSAPDSLLAETGGSISHAVARLMDACDANFVVVAPDASEFEKLETLARHLERLGTPYAVVPPMRGMSILSLEPQRFYSHDVMMLTFRVSLTNPQARILKRTFDIALASALIAVLSPFLLVVSLLIRRDGGSAFFRQTRIGRSGRRFGCLKFRTMVVDAEQRLADVLATCPEARRQWEADHKLKDDPRITPVGAFLRHTSLDELPQLFNVIRGEMSLVGPRPIVEAEIARYGDEIDFYLASLPGITGLWQVSGRNDTSYQRRVQLDRWYTQNWSLWQDIAILCKTLPAVLNRRGAY